MELRIKEICIEKGLSIAKLGELIGVSRSSMTSTVNNGNPTVETLQKIAFALEVDITDLFCKNTKEDSGLIALIHHQSKLYKAETVEELEKIIIKIKMKI